VGASGGHWLALFLNPPARPLVGAGVGAAPWRRSGDLGINEWLFMREVGETLPRAMADFGPAGT